MHVLFVLDQRLQSVVRRRASRPHQTGKPPLGRVEVSRAGRRMKRGDVAGLVRIDNRVQRFVVPSPHRLYPRRVPMQDLQHRQRRFRGRQFACHLSGGQECHERVEADVILASETPRIRQRPGCEQIFQASTRPHQRDQLRQQFVGGRPLQQGDERLARAERQGNGLLLLGGPGGRRSQLGGERRPHAGRQHGVSHLGQKRPTIRRSTIYRRHGHSPRNRKHRSGRPPGTAEKKRTAAPSNSPDGFRPEREFRAGRSWQDADDPRRETGRGRWKPGDFRHRLSVTQFTGEFPEIASRSANDRRIPG